MPGSNGLGFLVILNKSGELRFGLRRSELIFQTWVRPVQFVACGVCAFVGWVSELRADDGRTVSIEKLCLSLLVSKNLNLKKVIKVSYLNQESRQCFVFFGFLCVWTFYALCTFHVSVSWLCYTGCRCIWHDDHNTFPFHFMDPTSPNSTLSFVVYWPTTRPGCQNRKCTCVNNRCTRSRNSRV